MRRGRLSEEKMWRSWPHLVVAWATLAEMSFIWSPSAGKRVARHFVM